MDDHSFLLLTDLGQETAKKIYERHCFLLNSLSPQVLTPRLRRPTPAGLNTLSVRTALKKSGVHTNRRGKT